MKSKFSTYSVADLIRIAAMLFAMMVLTACGGGGGSPGSTPNKPPTSTTPNLVLTLVGANAAAKSTVAVGDPLTALVRYTDAGGAPLGGKLISFTFSGAAITLNPTSGKVLTDPSGMAMVTFVPANNPYQAGDAGNIVAADIAGDKTVATSNAATYQFALNASITPGLTLTLVDANGTVRTTVSNTSPLTARAKYIDTNGKPVPNKLVLFRYTGADVQFTPTSGQVLTDASGFASLTFTPKSANFQKGDAGSITAQVIATDGQPVSSSTISYQFSSGVGVTGLLLTLVDAQGNPRNTVSNSSPLTARINYTDVNGKPVEGKLINFSYVGARVAFLPVSGQVLTNSAGVASITLVPQSSNFQTGDAGTITATATLDTTTISSNTVSYQFSFGTSGPSYMLLSLVNPYGVSSNVVSAADPLTARAKVTDINGQPVPGKLVQFKSTGAAVTLSPASGNALTDSAGFATITLIPRDVSYDNGDAGSISATVDSDDSHFINSNAMTFQFLKGINTVPHIDLTLVDANGAAMNTVTNTAPLMAWARFSDANGLPLVGRVVTFSSTGAAITFTPAIATVLTDGSGYARVSLAPANLNFQTGEAGTILASSIGDDKKTITSNQSTFQFIQGVTLATKLTLSLVDSTGVSRNWVTNTSALTAKVKFTDSNGQALVGKVVAFTSAGTAAVTFSPASGSVLTDSTGSASVTFVPAKSDFQTGDAGTISASAATDDFRVIASNSVAYQFSFGVPIATSLVMSLADSAGVIKNTLTVGSSLSARAKLTDLSGQPVVGKIVSFTYTGAAITMTPPSGTVITDSVGVATVIITPTGTNIRNGDAGAITATTITDDKRTIISNSGAYQFVATPPVVTTLVLSLVDSTGVSKNTLSNSAPLTARGILTDSNGNRLGGKIITFSSNGASVTFSPISGVVLTDASGMAALTFAPTNSNYQSGDAGSVVAKWTSDEGVLITSNVVTYQLGAVGATIVNSLDLTLEDSVTGLPKNTMTGPPLTAKVKFTDSKGTALGGKVVTFIFTGAAVTFSPGSGTVLTDANGVAKVTATPASLNFQTGDAGFISAKVVTDDNRAIDSNRAPYQFGPAVGGGVTTLDLTLVDSNGVSKNSLTNGSPLIARAKFADASGKALVGKIVAFSPTGAGITMSPVSGTVLTDAAGVASVPFVPANLNYQPGDAGSIIAAATTDDKKSISSNIANYQLGAADISLALISPTNGEVSINAYGTTLIAVDVLVAGLPYTSQPVTINLSSSSCVAAKRATLASTVVTVNGRAQAVYTDIGCGQTDTITASVAGSAKPVTALIKIAAPQIASIQSVSATPADKSIVIKGAGGSGRSETATLTFKVLDTAGNAVANQKVDFTLFSTKPVVLSTLSGLTDSNGLVVATVNSGTEPTTFRVTAAISPNGPSTISDTITVTTGIPIQLAMSMSSKSSNFSGWDHDNEKVDITVLLADQSGNPVADNTPIVLQTDSGAVGLSAIGGCITTNGGCTVPLRSQAPRYGVNANNVPAGKRGGFAVVNASTTTGATLTAQIGVFLSGDTPVHTYLHDGDEYYELGTGINNAVFTQTPTGSVATFVNVANSCSGSLLLSFNDINYNPMPEGTIISIANGVAINILGVYPGAVPSTSPPNSSGSFTGHVSKDHLVKFTFPEAAIPPLPGSRTCVLRSNGGLNTTNASIDVVVKVPFGGTSLFSFVIPFPSP